MQWLSAWFLQRDPVPDTEQNEIPERSIPPWEPLALFVALYLSPQLLVCLLLVGCLYSRTEWQSLLHKMHVSGPIAPEPAPNNDEGALTRVMRWLTK